MLTQTSFSQAHQLLQQHSRFHGALRMGTGMRPFNDRCTRANPANSIRPGRQAGGPLCSPAAGWLLHRHVMALMTNLISLDRHDTISFYSSLSPSSSNSSGSTFYSSSTTPLMIVFDPSRHPPSSWGDEQPRRSLTCRARTSEQTCEEIVCWLCTKLLPTP